MSYIRPTAERRYSNGETMYVFSNADDIYFQLSNTRVDSEDFVEIMLRVLERTKVEIDDELVDQVRKGVHLDSFSKQNSNKD
jgi:hypothetical protein